MADNNDKIMYGWVIDCWNCLKLYLFPNTCMIIHGIAHWKYTGGYTYASI